MNLFDWMIRNTMVYNVDLVTHTQPSLLSLQFFLCINTTSFGFFVCLFDNVSTLRNRIYFHAIKGRLDSVGISLPLQGTTKNLGGGATEGARKRGMCFFALSSNSHAPSCHTTPLRWSGLLPYLLYCGFEWVVTESTPAKHNESRDSMRHKQEKDTKTSFWWLDEI